MSWEDLLDEGSERVLPWYGYRRIHDAERTWTISGVQPPEHGWYKFEVTGGRNAHLKARHTMEIDPDWAGNQPKLSGYLVGDRIIPDNARVDLDPTKLIQQTTPVRCLELGMDRFARATVIRSLDGNLVYFSQEFPLGPEDLVRRAYQDKKNDLTGISGVTPALDLAFRFASQQRTLAEERRRELERLREEELKRQAEHERLERAMRDAGTAVGRRALAKRDFETAAREALRISGAELLDVRDSYHKGEKVVQYLFRHRRLECVVDANTLRIIDAGVCLSDHDGTKGDTFFTLESLPGVIGEAMDGDKLVVWRHVGDDEEDW